MTHRLLMLALLLCGSACIYGSEFCSRDDAETVTTITNEITRGMNPQSFITMSTDSFVQLMEAYPETKQLFARVQGDDPTSPEFAAHAYRVVNAFSVFLPALNDTAVLVEMASHLAKQHAVRTGIKREHFKLLGKIIRKNMRQLANNFDEDAWDRCFKPVVKAIMVHLP